jgi:hypothetical protein
MVIHSDSNFGAFFALLMMLAAAGGVLAATSLFAAGNSSRAWKILAASGVSVAVYLIALVAFSLTAPGKIVKVGESYCMDIWCIGIERVSATPVGAQVRYKADVRIFSDANRVKTSAWGTTLYLVDDRGRRFAVVSDPSAIPFDVTLDPGQSVRTSLTFLAAADARHLFLTGDAAEQPPFWVKLYFGSDDSLLHKRTLLRVL